MTKALNVRHLRAHFGSFTVILHLLGVKLTTKNTKDTENFASLFRSAERLRSPERDANAAGEAASFPHYVAYYCWMMRLLLLASALVCASCGRAETQVADYAAQRERMVKGQIIMRGVVEERVLAAMRKVPREEFVPAEFRAESYTDRPLPIGYDQTISQPFIVAFMTEELRPKSTDRVLEIGTGSGYQAAILAELVAEVYSIEIIEPLAKNAEATLQRLGYKNVHVKAGDGYKGWPEHAPFDSIIVTCAPERVPQPLIDQLKEGGRMIIPVGAKFAQELYLLEKKSGRLEQNAVLPVRFVPMAGEGTEK
jgi:protein-L-isoaspartate(D-aspartate) O-methyltransferase